MSLNNLYLLNYSRLGESARILWSIEAGYCKYVSVYYTTVGSDNGLTSVRRQAIFWPNAGLLFIGTMATNINEILIKLQQFSCNNTIITNSSNIIIIISDIVILSP